MIGVVPAILFGVAIELMHGGLALLIVQPFAQAVDIVSTSIPPMIVAVSLGVASVESLFILQKNQHILQKKMEASTAKKTNQSLRRNKERFRDIRIAFALTFQTIKEDKPEQLDS